MSTQPAAAEVIDSHHAFKRLMLTLLLVTLGSSSMYVVAVVLPAVQMEFGVSRADASLPYTVMMLGLGVGGIYMGRWADRQGVHVPLFWGGWAVGSGFILAGLSQNIWLFALLIAFS